MREPPPYLRAFRAISCGVRIDFFLKKIFVAKNEMSRFPGLSQEKLDTLPRLLELKNEDMKILVRTHASMHNGPSTFQDPDNDDYGSLKFIGISSLSLMTIEVMTKEYPGLRVGSCSKIKALVLQEDTISQISRYYRLEQTILCNRSQKVVLQQSIKTQAELFEAYVGGLTEDWGFEYIRGWLRRVLIPFVIEAYSMVRSEFCIQEPNSIAPTERKKEERQPIIPTDTKHNTVEGHLPLLNLLFSKARISPGWELEVSGSKATPIWKCNLVYGNVVLCNGHGNTKKLAKNDAARKTIEILRNAGRESPEGLKSLAEGRRL